MDISHLNYGILHSLIGKNDGVSIVIDQTVNAMVDDMGIELGNIFFLAAHSSPRFNAITNEIFWHKNDVHRNIITYFNEDPPDWLDSYIHENALYAKQVISKFVEDNEIDLLIAHNTTHPYNFITAVGLGYYFEELRNNGIVWPKIMVWWHDSYFERARFSNPNKVIQKYLKYLPGLYIDGMAFINSDQPMLARKLFEQLNKNNIDNFFKFRSVIVPNTSSIDWDWKSYEWDKDSVVFPEQDKYNSSFLKDTGILEKLQEKRFALKDAIFLLQHTRIVPRKKIELALDFAFRLENKFLQNGQRKLTILLVSGHSGDEQVKYKEFLIDYYANLLQLNPESNVLLIMGENIILSHRDIIVDKKYYNFYEIPSIISSYGGMGTYFSEVEGFGNNLLEMISFGLPVVINKYNIFKKDIESLGFDLPAVEDGLITEELIDKAYEILCNPKIRNGMVKHNLKILDEKLDHKIIAEKLVPLLKNIFTRSMGC